MKLENFVVPLAPLAIGAATGIVNVVSKLIGRQLLQGRRVHEFVSYSLYHQSIGWVVRSILDQHRKEITSIYVAQGIAAVSVWVISKTGEGLSWKSALVLGIANSALAFLAQRMDNNNARRPTSSSRLY